MDQEMLKLYTDFVIERHAAWHRRQYDLKIDPCQPPVWSTDKIINAKKFTNVFRILDYGSQFVVKDLLYSDDPVFHTQLIRAFLYRYTNRAEPWIAFKEEMGSYPNVLDFQYGIPLEFWKEYASRGNPIFGSAYKMFSGHENKGSTRLEWAVGLAKKYITYGFADEMATYTTIENRIALLRTIPRCAAFMSMQIATDIGLSEYVQANEDEYIVAGPGARVGAKYIMPDRSPEQAIKDLWLRWHFEDYCPKLRMPDGSWRYPSLMDVQNTLCEFSKYVRYWQNGTGNSVFKPAHPGLQPQPFYPPHWYNR